MLSHMLDLFFPRKSLLRTEGIFLTEEEKKLFSGQITMFSKDMLAASCCNNLECVLAALAYDAHPGIHRAVHLFKYKRMKHFAPIFAHAMAEAAHVFPKTSDSPVLCPVPLHWTRKFWRGFNQAELLAKHIAHATGWEVCDLLVRTRPTGHQAHRRKSERLRAMENAFRIRAEKSAPTNVILVDDIFTTGATLNACAFALRKANCKHVSALVFAHG